MFFRKKSEPVPGIDTPTTVIGKGVYIEAARMTGGEGVHIEGIFKGNIELAGSLVLGDGGSINGDVRAAYFLAAGEVNGNITCEQQLHCAGTSRIMGDIKAASLVVDEGAAVSGHYTVGKIDSTPHLTATNFEDRLIKNG